jgi:hypothetical protein
VIDAGVTSLSLAGGLDVFSKGSAEALLSVWALLPIKAECRMNIYGVQMTTSC